MNPGRRFLVQAIYNRQTGINVEIHAPHEPVHSLKDAAIHILIVTIGILIALGLEGIRETIHDHGLVREARDSFREELTENKKKIAAEIENVEKTRTVIEAILSDLPELRKHPDQLQTRLTAIRPSMYILQNTSWDAALSAGALAHMGTSEVALYGQAAQSSRLYSTMEDRLLPTWFEIAAWRAPSKPDEPALNGLEGKLRIMSMFEAVMEHGARQSQDGIDQALKAASQ